MRRGDVGDAIGKLGSVETRLKLRECAILTLHRFTIVQSSGDILYNWSLTLFTGVERRMFVLDGYLGLARCWSRSYRRLLFAQNAYCLSPINWRGAVGERPIDAV